MRRGSRKGIALAVAFAMMITGFAFGAAPAAAKTTEANTPVGVGNAHLKWEKQFGTGYNNAVTPPLLLGGNLYVGSAGTLYKLNKDTGEVLDSCALEGLSGFTTIAPAHNGTAADGSDATRIYVNLSDKGDGGEFHYINARIAAVDIGGDKMKIDEAWPDGGTETFGDQAISPVVHHNGYLYTGGYDTSAAGNRGRYVEIDAATGEIKSTLAQNANGGFYWAGAYVTDEFAVFGEEAVTDRTSEDYGKSVVRCVATSGNTEDAAGTLLSSVEVEGTVRGSMVCHEEAGTKYLYFVSQAGRLYKAAISDDGILGEPVSVTLSGASVGVPQVTDTRAYVGTGAAKLDVIDIQTMSVKYSVSVPGYPQGELLIRKKDDSTDYIYGSYNKKPGGVFFAEAGESGALQSGVLYDPEHPEFSLSPVICDEEGTLFVKNDSGYIYAVAEGAPEEPAEPEFDRTAPVLKKTSVSAAQTKLSWSARAGASAYEVYRATSANGTFSRLTSTAATSFADKKTLPKTAYYYKVRAKVDGKYTDYSNVVTAKAALAKPKVTTKAGKRKITVSWKKITGATGYKVYRATKKNGKYKLVKTIGKQSTVKFVNKKLKKNRKYYYKVRAYKTVSGKTGYGAYSKISYKKVK